MDDALTENGRKITGVIERCGTWAVTVRGIESLTAPYLVEKNRVHEPDWLEHMCEKTWIKISDFLDALNIARDIWRK